MHCAHTSSIFQKLTYSYVNSNCTMGLTSLPEIVTSRSPENFHLSMVDIEEDINNMLKEKKKRQQEVATLNSKKKWMWDPSLVISHLI